MSSLAERISARRFIISLLAATAGAYKISEEAGRVAVIVLSIAVIWTLWEQVRNNKQRQQRNK